MERILPESVSEVRLIKSYKKTPLRLLPHISFKGEHFIHPDYNLPLVIVGPYPHIILPLQVADIVSPVVPLPPLLFHHSAVN